MNTQKIEGTWKVIKGTIVEKLGELFGNDKLKSDGEAERVRGKITSAVASNGSPTKPSEHRTIELK